MWGLSPIYSVSQDSIKNKVNERMNSERSKTLTDFSRIPILDLHQTPTCPSKLCNSITSSREHPPHSCTLGSRRHVDQSPCHMALLLSHSIFASLPPELEFLKDKAHTWCPSPRAQQRAGALSTQASCGLWRKQAGLWRRSWLCDLRQVRPLHRASFLEG